MASSLPVSDSNHGGDLCDFREQGQPSPVPLHPVPHPCWSSFPTSVFFFTPLSPLLSLSHLSPTSLLPRSAFFSILLILPGPSPHPFISPSLPPASSCPPQSRPRAGRWDTARHAGPGAREMAGEEGEDQKVSLATLSYAHIHLESWRA